MEEESLEVNFGLESITWEPQAEADTLDIGADFFKPKANRGER